MSSCSICVMAGKEFKGYFSSWSAYIFIAVFLVASLVAFFFAEQFFGVGRADIRGFFNWIPALFLVLIPGITMRQWARENEMGSVEVLMTLPARTSDIVLGKFLGCLALATIALAFTVGIPITASALGELDWGPVMGGYIGATLLAAAYIAIGLFVSGWFSDQFLAWVVSIIVCLVMAGMSHPTVMGWFSGMPDWFTSTLEFTGFWNRFQKVGRGVLDFRDVAYYLSVTGLFLYLNVSTMRFRRWA